MTTELQRIILSVTQIQTAPLAPEIRFAGLPHGETLESFRTRNEPMIGLMTPYWAVPWPGGQALSRYLLDHSTEIAGKRVIDFGCGNGASAVAAAMAGASHVLAIDNDRNALAATQICAQENGVSVETACADFSQIDSVADIICAGDLWYDQATGRHAGVNLRRLLSSGARILIGDALRPSRMRRGVAERARYSLSVPAEFGRFEQIYATVSELSQMPCN